ncbi:exocyst complex component 4 [Ischnura elegans]|uniref:exocyst complex component 4 n=1 Tax=Ischnura elegans TaxID=197161 RepID=UPI001ED8A01E|nr:exocyst complex component 4 [Ischnura elegans]
MALPGPPAKPPRGVKHPKETSGLLMSVIRTLSASESNEQRDREKAKLEKEYKKSDQRLDELISLHDEDLSQIMQLFGQLSNMVSSSREKVHTVKENLQACKMLLRCRRDELQKLWIEGVEHKHVLYLLEEIDKLIGVPNQLEKYVAKKHYLHATKLLVSAIATSEGTLARVEALREVRVDLKAKKEQLNQKLMAELSRYLYIQTSQEALNLRRQGSGRESGSQYTPLQRVGSGRARPSEQVHPKSRRALLDVSFSPAPGVQNQRGDVQVSGGVPVDELNNIQEDIDEEDPEGRREHFMAILVECLACLGKLPDAVEDIKKKMQDELLAIVKKTTQQVLIDAGGGSAIVPGSGVTVPVISLPSQQDQSASQGKALLDLLQTVFDQFRLIAAAHACILQCFCRATEKYRIDVQLYEMVDVWSKIQAVVQLMLTDYLDMKDTPNAQHQGPTSFSDTSTDISSYFSRKKPQRQKRSSLFKFDYSSHSLSMNSYLKEQKDDGLLIREKESYTQADPNLARQQRVLVCQPDPKNITQIFIPLMKFIEEIERGIGQPGPCTLSNVLSDYVKGTFLGQHHQLVSSSVDTATKASDAWRTTTDSETTRSLGVSRPLLVSTITVEKCIRDLQNLSYSLPTYAENFLGMMCSVLRSYRETCHAAYRSIVQPDSEDKRVFSAAWLKDEDISRFLKSLPNWTDLQAQKALQQQMVKQGLYHHGGASDDVMKNARGHLDGVGGRIGGQGRSEEEESPEEVRQRNAREAEILAGNLGEGGINAHEIISDVNQLKVLAQLQESMEWFAGSISVFVAGLPGQSTSQLQTMPSPSSGTQNSDSFPPIPEATLKALQQQVRDFEDLADTCLLVLHLEVRVQCFHYLLPRSSGSSSGVFSGMDSQEPDPKVLELSRVLVGIDEAMSSSLKPRKSKYIFEGLGHLIAKILIGSCQNLEHIDEMAIGKMCKNIFTLQQTLTNITMAREVALDYARRYYEMFYQTPEEILNGVVDKGPQFSELEYMNALQLLNKSRGDSADFGTINQQLERLSEILGEVGVTV